VKKKIIYQYAPKNNSPTHNPNQVQTLTQELFWVNIRAIPTHPPVSVKARYTSPLSTLPCFIPRCQSGGNGGILQFWTVGI